MKFHRNFLIGRKIFVLTFRMWWVVPIRDGSNQNTMPKYYPITTRLRKLLTLHPPSMRTTWELSLSMAYGTRDFEHQSEQQQQRDDDLRSPLMSAINVKCLRTANLLFMAYGTRDFQHSIRTAARKSQTTTHDSPISSRVCRPFELLVNCQFALRGSDSFRPSEPKKLNTCNVALTRPVHINCNRASKVV